MTGDEQTRAEHEPPAAGPHPHRAEAAEHHHGGARGWLPRLRRRWGRGGRDGWRLATPAVVIVSGVLFAVSAASSQGTDLRPGRYRDLGSVVATESRDYDRLQDRLGDLTADVDRLTDAVADADVARIRRRADRLRDPAGLEPRTGPGVTVVLSDSPDDVFEDALAQGDDFRYPLNRLLVHQQDIQAVVNAMWAAGASAVTVEGQRIVSTTGIKCDSSAVQLQGRPYPEPYEISAVGDPVAIGAALESDSLLEFFREDAANPAIDIGYEQTTEAEIQAPAYDGLLDITYAQPLR